MAMLSTDFPDGTLAYRGYDAELNDGAAISLGITLEDLEADTIAAQFARERKAVAYGLISVLEMPDDRKRPIVWIVDHNELSLALEVGEQPISAELVEVLQLYLGLFFIQAAPIAPQLGHVWIAPDAEANDNKGH
jgi:hypothetical protein